MHYTFSGWRATSVIKSFIRSRILYNVNSSTQLYTTTEACRHAPTAAAASILASRLQQQQQHDKGGFGSSHSSWWIVSGLAALVAIRGFPAALTEAETSQSEPQSEGSSNASTAQWRLYTNIGQELFQKGRTSEAETYFKRALQEAKKGFGEADAHVAAACNNLAEFYRVTKQPEKAEPLYLEGLRLFEGAYGRKDVRFAQAMHNLAGFYFLQKSFLRSQQYYKQALQAKADTLGVDHPSYADTMMRLGDALRLGGQKEDAIAVLRQALELQDAAGPQAGRGRLSTASRLGQLLLDTGHEEEGEAVLRRVLEQAQDLHASNPQQMPGWHLAIYVENVANALVTKGDLTGARDMLHQALSLRRAGDRGNARLSEALLNLANLELEIGGRDGQLRAHNLAKQADALNMATWNRLLHTRTASSPGWFSSLWGKAPAASLSPEEGQQKMVVAAINVAKACHTAAKAQALLGRREDAGGTLFRGLEVLMHEGVRQTSIGTPVSLDDEDPAAVMEQLGELVRLHHAVTLAQDILSSTEIAASLSPATMVTFGSYMDSLRSMVPNWQNARPDGNGSVTAGSMEASNLQFLRQASSALESAIAQRTPERQ